MNKNNLPQEFCIYCEEAFRIQYSDVWQYLINNFSNPRDYYGSDCRGFYGIRHGEIDASSRSFGTLLTYEEFWNLIKGEIYYEIY